MTAAMHHGGPAFPVADYDHQTFASKRVEDTRRLLSGMSLRDYFAAKALAGMLAYHNNEGRGDFHTNSTPEANAQMAYLHADAMLKARVA